MLGAFAFARGRGRRRNILAEAQCASLCACLPLTLGVTRSPDRGSLGIVGVLDRAALLVARLAISAPLMLHSARAVLDCLVPLAELAAARSEAVRWDRATGLHAGTCRLFRVARGAHTPPSVNHAARVILDRLVLPAELTVAPTDTPFGHLRSLSGRILRVEAPRAIAVEFVSDGVGCVRQLDRRRPERATACTTARHKFGRVNSICHRGNDPFSAFAGRSGCRPANDSSRVLVGDDLAVLVHEETVERRVRWGCLLLGLLVATLRFGVEIREERTCLLSRELLGSG